MSSNFDNNHYRRDPWDDYFKLALLPWGLVVGFWLAILVEGTLHLPGAVKAATFGAQMGALAWELIGIGILIWRTVRD